MKFKFSSQVLQSPSAEKLACFGTDAVKVYKKLYSIRTKSPNDCQPGDDACIVAAMAIVHLGLFESSNARQSIPTLRFLQVAALLDMMSRQPKFNYQALLILVRTYLNLGCGSAAFKAYGNLSIKHLQLDTVAHNLFTRISTIHPWPAKNRPKDSTTDEDRDPRLGLEQALNFYEKNKEKIPKMTKLAVEYGSYGQVIGVLDLAKKMENSVCRFLWEVELRRTLRACNASSSATICLSGGFQGQ